MNKLIDICGGIILITLTICAVGLMVVSLLLIPLSRCP